MKEGTGEPKDEGRREGGKEEGNSGRGDRGGKAGRTEEGVYWQSISFGVTNQIALRQHAY